MSLKGSGDIAVYRTVLVMLAQKVLQSPHVHTLGRERVACRVPKHVRMNGEGECGALASPLDHSTNAHPTERLTSFIDEYICGFQLLHALQTFKSCYLIAFQVWVLSSLPLGRRT